MTALSSLAQDALQLYPYGNSGRQRTNPSTTFLVVLQCWLIQQGLTAPPTQWETVLQVKRPNQQYQST